MKRNKYAHREKKQMEGKMEEGCITFDFNLKKPTQGRRGLKTMEGRQE